GNFTFTTDLTGLQTFYKDYENGIPLGTQSNWGWHTIPNTEGYQLQETELVFNSRGREIPFLHKFRDGYKAKVGNYFRENPHRLHLGMIGLVITKEDDSIIDINDIKNAKHQLNLWKGEITSEFKIDNIPVKVEVFCHQELDMISVKIESPLISNGQLSVQWKFSYGVPENTHPGYDFSVSEKHTSTIVNNEINSALILRKLDNDQYFVKLQWQTPAELINVKKHQYTLLPKKESNVLEFSCLFSPDSIKKDLPDFKSTSLNSIKAWKNFWKNGGAVDFSECTDSRAKEIERRIVLSQYLTKIQCSGNLPPAETGLTYNSWYGKFHLEMHWWHVAHFPMWNRPEYLAKQMEYYFHIIDKARETAKKQGFKGIRWPKMTDPEGQESPSNVGTYLIWQQPHFIYFAEQLYQAQPSEEILLKYKELVFETAEFMADFPVYDSINKVYNLVPPLIPAQELWSRETTMNPPFELSYWYWGLSTAQEWHKRLNLPVNEKWEGVRNNLPAPVFIDSIYMGIGNAPDSYTNPENMRDHPMVLGSLGMLPEWDKIDKQIMKNTLNIILEKWNWPSTWGWDYPMVAMCATRLGEPEIAIEALLMDVQKNTYLKNGHNYQSSRLRIYLPGNGGLLKAIALMCAGWEGCEIENPGFPKDGKWNVKWENLSKDF
ncbi:MAG: hypothetical protein JXB17_10425, partial [Bacteroidales bacterium]|nr:hypothetical protein [Bacteroidales bacterium]